MRVLLPLPVVLPLLGAGLSMAAARRRWLQRVIGLTVLTATSAVSVAILVQVDRHGPSAAFMGGWRAPVGISLVADRLSALMLVVATPVLLAVLVFATGQPGTEKEQPAFHPVYLVLAAGISLSFLTGDLFNRSWRRDDADGQLLITIGGWLTNAHRSPTGGQPMSTCKRCSLDHAATGTVNMADLSAWLPSPAGSGFRSRSCCSWCSASRPQCSPCSSGSPTATPPPPPRSPPCSPGC
jgi:multicomponent Na+:H+ antiporter subunit D